VGVLLLALLALGLRARGIGFGLPHATFSDARVLVDQIAALRADEPDPDDHRLYPHLVPRVASWLPDAEASPAPDDELDTHLARAAQPYLQARWVSVLLSLLILPATYKLARLSLARGPSLFATALVATSLLHVSFAQQERPHGALAAFTALAVLAAIHLRRRPSIGAYLLSGVAAALALGALHSGVAVLIPLVAAHLLRERTPARGPAWGLVPPLVVALSIPFFYPFQFAETQRLAVESQGDASVLNLSGHFVKLETFDGGGFSNVLGSLYSHDPLLLALAAVGASTWLLRRSKPGRDQLVLLAYAVPYFLVIGLYGKSAERFALPLLPFLACLAAAPLQRMPRALVPAALLLLVPLGLARRLGHVRAAPDTYSAVAAWVADNVPAERRVLLVLDPNQDLPLAQDAAALAAGESWPWPSRWFEYQLRRPQPLTGARDVRVPSGVPLQQLSADPLAALRACGAEVVVVERVAGGPRSALQRDIRAALARSAARSHVVAPGAGEEGARLFVRQVSWRRPLFRRLLDVERTGPTLEVYDLYTPQ
jgi:hypothetical protein